jgi:hypothetical protein
MELPPWVGILQAAESWGCPPWEVTGEQPPNRVLWFLRRGAYETEIGRAGKDKSKHGKK